MKTEPLKGARCPCSSTKVSQTTESRNGGWTSIISCNTCPMCAGWIGTTAAQAKREARDRAISAGFSLTLRKRAKPAMT